MVRPMQPNKFYICKDDTKSIGFWNAIRNLCIFMFTPITRFFVCIFWNAVRNHRISMFTPITRFLVCICRLCASTPVNGHKLSVAVYDTRPLTLNSLHYYYQDYAFQSYRPKTMKAIQNNKDCNPV